MTRLYVLFGLTVALLLLPAFLLHADASKNGFVLDQASVPVAEILHGGPPKDGIPAINEPQFVTAMEATWLRADDRVLGLFYQGIARAYPIRILNWHEVVNDRFAADSVAITFCPLCGSGVAFLNPDSVQERFGVSGLLYNSDVLLYDESTQSLWSQIRGEAIAGSRVGERLTPLAMEHTTWKQWLAQYPQSEVLDRSTGFNRDYGNNPYAGYAESSEVYFPVRFKAAGFHPKEKVIGLVHDGVARAWPFVELRRSETPFIETLGDLTIEVHYDPESDSARLVDAEGRMLPATTLFWFAWAAFYPETSIYRIAKE